MAEIKSLSGMSERVEMLVQQITMSTEYFPTFVSDTEVYGIRVATAMLVQHAAKLEGSVVAVVRHQATKQLYKVVLEMERRAISHAK